MTRQACPFCGLDFGTCSHVNRFPAVDLPDEVTMTPEPRVADKIMTEVKRGKGSAVKDEGDRVGPDDEDDPGEGSGD